MASKPVLYEGRTINTVSRFITREDIFNDRGYLLDKGTLTIMCNITMIPNDWEQHHLQITNSRNSKIVTQSTSDAFVDLFRNGLPYHDIELITGDGSKKSFKAHRAVLASNSRVFIEKIAECDAVADDHAQHSPTSSRRDGGLVERCMYSGEGEDETGRCKNKVVINNYSADVINDMVSVIYAGQAPKLRENVHALLAFSDEYEIDSLKSRCEKELEPRITSQNALDVLLLAERHRAAQLKQAAACWIARNPRDAKMKKEWDTVTDNINLMVFILEARAELLSGLTYRPMPLQCTSSDTKMTVYETWIPARMKTTTFSFSRKVISFLDPKDHYIMSEFQFGDFTMNLRAHFPLNSHTQHFADLHIDFQITDKNQSYRTSVPHELDHILVKACLVGSDDIKYNIVHERCTFQSFQSRYYSIQFEQFSSLPIDANQTIMFCITLVIMECSQFSHCPARLQAVPGGSLVPRHKPNISPALVNMYRDKLFMDFTLIVGAREFHVHRAVLAVMSPVLARMISEAEARKETSCSIDDSEPEIIEDMLLFAYEGRWPSTQQNTCKLLAASNKYDISSLKAHCEYELAQSLTTENAADILLLADQCHAPRLRQRALELVVNCLPDVIVTQGWKPLTQNKIIVQEMLETAINAYDLTKELTT